eukprot:550399-Amphidinium_carterae.1
MKHKIWHFGLERPLQHSSLLGWAERSHFAFWCSRHTRFEAAISWVLHTLQCRTVSAMRATSWQDKDQGWAFARGLMAGASKELAVAEGMRIIARPGPVCSNLHVGDKETGSTSNNCASKNLMGLHAAVAEMPLKKASDAVQSQLYVPFSTKPACFCCLIIMQRNSNKSSTNIAARLLVAHEHKGGRFSASAREDV